MSTICKLDPLVRVERTSRRDIVRSLERIAVRLRGLRQLAATAVLTVLLDILHNPIMTGAAKGREFVRIIEQQEKNT